MSQVIAHRGDPVGHRENTLASFISAEQLGADMVEIDVQVTRDGACVILHDKTLTRLWNVHAAVSEKTTAEIRQLCQSPDGTIPELKDVFEAVSTPVMVDFTDLETVEPMVAELQRIGVMERCLIVTGNTDALRLVRRLAPSASIGLTWNDCLLPSMDLISELQVAYFNPHWRLFQADFTKRLADAVVSANEHQHQELKGLREHRIRYPHEFQRQYVDGQRTVDWFHQQGIKVSCWTVDNEQDIEFVHHIGVDAITSNRTGTAVRLVH